MTVRLVLTVIDKDRTYCFPKADSLPNTIRLICIPPGNTDHKELCCQLRTTGYNGH